jgi:hypothetical protein
MPSHFGVNGEAFVGVELSRISTAYISVKGRGTQAPAALPW